MAELGKSLVLTYDTAEFIAHERRWKIDLILLGGMAFVAIGTWMFVEPGNFGQFQNATETEIWYAGLVTLLFFGALCIEALGRLIREPEVLEIGHKGIRYTRWSSETIQWSSIRDVRMKTYRGNSTIQVFLRDRAMHPGRQPIRFTQAVFRGLTGADFDISLGQLSRKC